MQCVYYFYYYLVAASKIVFTLIHNSAYKSAFDNKWEGSSITLYIRRKYMMNI